MRVVRRLVAAALAGALLLPAGPAGAQRLKDLQPVAAAVRRAPSGPPGRPAPDAARPAAARRSAIPSHAVGGALVGAAMGAWVAVVGCPRRCGDGGRAYALRVLVPVGAVAGGAVGGLLGAAVDVSRRAPRRAGRR